MSDHGQIAAAAELIDSLSSDSPLVLPEMGQISISVKDGTSILADIVRKLDGARISISDIALTQPTLDDVFLSLSPNPPKDTDGRREGSGRGWVRELQGRWPGVLG